MLTGRESASIELTRSVFEQLVADRHRLPVERKFSTSLYRLGYSRWVAFEQAGGMKRHATPPAPPEDPDKRQQVEEQNEALRLLSLLPRDLKFLLVLSESNRLNFREIAEILDISEEAVARRISQATGLLSASLQRPALAAPSSESYPLQLREP